MPINNKPDQHEPTIAELKDRISYLEQLLNAATAINSVLDQAPQRKPLSDEEIDRIIDRNIETRDVHLRDAFHLSMRDVETAHDIHETDDDDDDDE